MTHTVDIEELKDFTFEQIVCSVFSHKERKKLLVYVNPYINFLQYRIYVDNKVECLCFTLEEALQEYNAL